MRFAGLWIAIALGWTVGAAQANEAKLQGYSKEYGQCMNLTYGKTEKAEKCVSNERKLHEKQLKKNFKAYKKANPRSIQEIQTQYKFWELQVKNQCQPASRSVQGRLQREQCALNMVISQSNLYAARLMNAKAGS